MDMPKHPAIDLRDAEPDAAPPAPPCTMVIFGAAGDLTKRLVVPALYNLVNAQRLDNGFRLLGVDLADLTAESWRDGLGKMMRRALPGTTAENSTPPASTPTTGPG